MPVIVLKPANSGDYRFRPLLSILYFIIFLMIIFLSPFDAAAFKYSGAAGPAAPSNTAVKIIAPNAGTDMIFNGQGNPNTTFWKCSGGRVIVADFDSDGNNDIIVASPYGEYDFSNDFTGMITIYKGPVTQATQGGTFSWDSGSWNQAVNVANTGYILGSASREHTGYAIAAGHFGARALVIGRAFETGTPSQVAVIFSRAINNLNGTGTAIKANLIDMSQTGNPAGTLGKNDMKNFSLLITNIPGANAPNASLTHPNNFLPVNGISLACGDVNSDGIDDIIIGCPGDNGGIGAVYVIKGKNTGWKDNDSTTDPITIDVTSMTTADGYKITGVNAGDNFGASVLVSDIYGDAKNELVIGAPGAQSAQGGAIIIPGGTIDGWTLAEYNVAVGIPNAKAISGPGTAGMRFGHALTSGKFHDSAASKNDLIVSEFVDANNSTSAYIIFGNAAIPAANPIPVDVTIKPKNAAERFGFAVSCGDINGDSFDDIAVTAPCGVIDDTNNRGKVYVIHGANYSSGTVIDLSNADRPFYDSSFQAQGNLDRLNTGNNSYYYGWGAVIAEAGGPGASRKELIVTAYSEVPSTTTAFANSGLCGVAYIMYTSTRPNQPVTTEIASPTSASNITLNWNNFSDPDTGDTMKCYHVQFSTDPDFKDFSKIIDSGVVTVAGNTTSHNLVINNDGVYHYRVRVGDDYSFSQFSTSRQLMINKTPPTNVEDITMPGPAPINGQNLVGTGGPRTIKIRVTDNIMCANQITAEVWIKSTDDVNANDVWDAGEGSTMIATPITPVAAVTDYSFNINEGATKDNIRIYITGWNAAKNLIPEALGGTRGNPKIEYNIHSNQGPVVSGWKINVSNPANPALKKFPDSDAAVFVNDPRPVITANLADDDSTVTNIRLKVQGAEFTVGGSLGYVDPLMTFTASSDLSNGSLPVELVSAEDAYGNPLQNITTTAGFVIDRNGPDADAANCQPINGGGSDKDQPVIVFALKDIAGADPFKVPGCGIKSSIEVRIINGGVTTVYTLDNSGVYAENGVIKTPGAITIDDSGAATGSYFIRFDMKLTDRHLINGATQAVVKAYDKLDNPMAGGTYTINFMVGLTGPQAEKSEPQPDNVKVNNAKIQIRIWSEEYAIDTQSVDFRIVGPAPASNIIYQKIGCNQSELVYDPLTTLLTFDPSKTAPPTVYEQGTITVFLNDVKDSEGNQLRSRPLTWTFIFDSIGPVAGTDTVPIKDAWTKNNKQIVKMKVFDVTTKVVGPTIKFKVDGNTYTTSSLGMNYDPLSTWITFDPTTQSVTFADKQITVELSEAFDEAGNPLTTGANNTWSFKVDSTPPAAFNFEPPQDAVRNVVSFPVRCRLTDDYSGIDTNSISFKINNSQITTFTVAPDGTLSYNATLPLGVNTCEVSVKDIAGNDLAGSPVKWSFVIDNNRMYVINDADSPKPAGNTFTNIAQNSVSLKMSKTFSGLDTDSIIFVVKQGGEQGATIPGTATAEEKTDHYLLTWTSTGGNFQEGIIYAALTQCLNNAGWNYDGAIFSWSFTYDKTKPAVTLDAQSPSPAKDSIQTNNKVPITIKLDDALSGIDLASLTLSIAAGGSPPPGTSYNVSDTQLTYDAVNKLLKFNTVNIFPDGKLVVTLTSAKDRAGNTYDTLPAGSLPYSWSFNIDTTLPVCQITRPAADNDIVLTNDDYITATLGDPQGINTNEIKITIVSSVDNTLENMLPITPPYFTFTADNPTNGTLKYDPKLKSPPLKFSDAFIDVYIYAKDNAGFEIVPNPIHRIYLVDTTGPVIIDGSKPPIVDSRLPAPLSTVGVSAAQPIFVKCRLEDMPAGVKNDSITYKFTTTDAAGNVLSDTATPLTVNNISPTVIELIYTRPNSVITAGAIPDVCTCEMEILSATDKTSALHTLRSKSTNKWMFYINNSNPIAINPYPANNTIITSDSAETGITLFHAFGINTASIEFYYNNTQALFPSSPANYLFVYDETGARLSFKPHGTAVSRWIEGTNTVELRHAKEKIGGKDIVAPVIWSFLCDTVPPLASMNFPNTQYVTNQNIDILINLTDATSGIDPASVTFAIKKQGEADFSSFYLTAGSDLSYANNILKYSSGQPYQPGTHEIKLTRAKDKAGHNYTTPPYPPGGETPLTFTFCVAKDGPVASIIQPLPDSVVDYILKPGSDEIIIKIEPPSG